VQRILVCDDDPQIRRVLSVILGDAGYDVLSTATGEQALDQAAVANPSLAIVDLMLPDHDGIELCARLREWSAMPILVLSAIDEEQAKIDALDKGADDYVTKPFGPGELVARVKAALRRVARDDTEPRVEVDGLVVDLAAHAVAIDGEQVHLTPTEFSLLRVLVLNRGRLMTHWQLLGEVWGPRHLDATPVLRTHIANLRAKLSSGGHEQLIRTESGIGYRFSA
jgi:two-component system, OmpR family, KDP operon response regulator KdpE